MSHQENLVRVSAVHNALGPLQNKVVYVGGATVSMYAQRPAYGVRETQDVDVLLEIWTLADFSEVESQLRHRGFINDQASGIIVRFRFGKLIVDIMPTGQDVLGFGNKWYPDGYTNAIEFPIDENQTVKIFSAPYFIASKLEAFKSPGREHNNDGMASRDFEDIVYVLENRFSVWDEMDTAPELVRFYLKEEFSRLIGHPRFEEWLSYSVGYGSPPADYYIMDRLKKFVG